MSKIKTQVFTVLFLFLGTIAFGQDFSDQFSSDKMKEIDRFIRKDQKKWKTPGISVAIINGENDILFQNYGYSDKKKSTEVSEHTLFEIASTSKAFTGLGLLLLVEDGKVSLKDPITKYFPWLMFSFEDQDVEVTVEDILYQKSGIPFNTVANIPIDDQPGAIERTVRTLIGTELDFKPGSQYLYATINYDILGLVMEEVTGMSYEDYIREEVLIPLGLNETYTNMENARNTGNMSPGYKISLLAAREYDAPYYRGHIPAGYIVSSSSDISRWLQIQMGLIEVPERFRNAIKKSHEADRTVMALGNGSSYGAGWSVFQQANGLIAHGGNNPSFSTYFGFSVKDRIGVAVLGNMNSDSTMHIANGVLDLIYNEEPDPLITDMYKRVDSASVVLILISLILFTLTLIYLISITVEIIKKERVYQNEGKNPLLKNVGTVLFLLGFAFCLYRAPATFLNGLDWDFINIWGSSLFFPALICVFSMVFLFTIYLHTLFNFQKDDGKVFFPLILLSSVAGLGNAFIVFTINAALFGDNDMRLRLSVYFILCIAIYIICQKVVRTKMAILTNQLIYKKRMNIIDNLLNTSFFQYEEIEEGSIQATLNNDTQQIANAPNLFVACISSFSTVLCCFIYLGIINVQGLLLSLVVIFIACICFFVVGASANRLWERTRDIQNIFFGHIDSLIKGFKELALNKNRRVDFRKDMNDCCEETRDKGTKAVVKFANVIVLGELLFTIVIGAVGFIFPLLFPKIPQATLLTFVFVFLYMNGPINTLLNLIPQVLQIRIAWMRIRNLVKEITFLNKSKKSGKTESKVDSIVLSLKDIEYKYYTEFDKFSVGPFNHEFKSGEITFITGGNGSGKTTLAKLITGLYEPEAGKILVNGNEVNYTDLNSCYSSVFSDYHLFNKLYGIDHEEKIDDIDKYLKHLKIDDKLFIRDGVFSSTELSTGQKKRLALLVSYLDDRPIFLFDEWAADQDPEFRKYFYHEILPGLKAMGKCVIAITHDDHYFDTADKVLKLEMGKIDSVEEKSVAV